MMLVSMVMICDSDHHDVDVKAVVMISVTNDRDVGIDDHDVDSDYHDVILSWY